MLALSCLYNMYIKNIYVLESSKRLIKARAQAIKSLNSACYMFRACLLGLSLIKARLYQVKLKLELELLDKSLTCLHY